MGVIKTMTPSMKFEGVKDSLTPCHGSIANPFAYLLRLKGLLTYWFSRAS